MTLINFAIGLLFAIIVIAAFIGLGSLLVCLSSKGRRPYNQTNVELKSDR